MALFGPVNQLDQATREQPECLVAELVVSTAENYVMSVAECRESTDNLKLACNISAQLGKHFKKASRERKGIPLEVAAPFQIQNPEIQAAIISVVKGKIDSS